MDDNRPLIVAIRTLVLGFLICGLVSCATYQGPKNLDECFMQLEQELSAENIEKIKTMTEDSLVILHFGLGRTIRNDWGLWGGSPLADWFNEKGLFHPDDMSGVILESYWRHLNGKPIELEKQIDHYREYWRIHAPPDDLKCPNCKEELAFCMSGFSLDSFFDELLTSVYQCPEGHHWFYSVDHGYYAPEHEGRLRVLDSLAERCGK